MAQIVANLIGVGAPKYTLPQTWEDDPPSADLVAADIIWQGEMMNQELVTATRILSIGSGTVTNANCYMHFTAAAGASYLDHPNKSTNPLRYDGTKGAALNYTGDTHATITIAAAYTRISKLQIANTSVSASASGAINCFGTTSTNTDVDQCICTSKSKNVSVGTVLMRNTGSRFRNGVAVLRDVAVAGAHALQLNSYAGATNVTAVALNCTIDYPLVTANAGGIAKNCYFGGGQLGAWNGGSAMTFTNCASDKAHASMALVPLSTATFNNITLGTHDLRTPEGSLLRDAGVVDSSAAAYDVYGTARPQNGMTDIGAWEVPAAADTLAPTLSNPVASSTGANSGSGSVTTNEANGSLACLFSVNATETAPTVNANGNAVPVTSIGTKTFNTAALTPSTSYFAHFCHTDASGNVSAVVSSLSFTTAAAGDTTDPVLSLMSVEATSSNAASGTVSTNEAGGLLYRYISTTAVESEGTVKAANLTQTVTTAGVQNLSYTGLTPLVTYYAHVLHRDAAGNDSAVATSTPFTMPAAPGVGSLTTEPYKNDSNQVLTNLANLKVAVLDLETLAVVQVFSDEVTDPITGSNVVSAAAVVPGTDYIHLSRNAAKTIVGAEIIRAEG